MVSIIIINYNTLELTLKCIASVKFKTLGLDFEIIVVDNDSSEANTVEVLSKLEGITFVPSNVNLGFAKGNNLGIKYAKGNQILLLNSDTELINNAVKIASDFLSESKGVAVAAAQLQYPDGRVQFSCKRFPSIKYLLLERLRLFKLLPKKIAGKILLEAFFDHKERVQPDWVAGTFFMFPRRILSLLPNGKLADDFFMYGEDIQWGFDIKNLGYKIQFLPEAKVLHHVGMSSDRSIDWMNENRKTIIENYYSTWYGNLLMKLEASLP